VDGLTGAFYSGGGGTGFLGGGRGGGYSGGGGGGYGDVCNNGCGGAGGGSFFNLDLALGPETIAQAGSNVGDGFVTISLLSTSDAVPVPEPAPLPIFGAAAIGAVLMHRRRSRGSR
jgi:hypothetical protein